MLVEILHHIRLIVHRVIFYDISYSTAVNMVNLDTFHVKRMAHKFDLRLVDFLVFHAVLELYHITHTNGEVVRRRKVSNEDEKSAVTTTFLGHIMTY